MGSMSAIEEKDDAPLSTEDGNDPLLGEFNRLKKEVRKAERARSEWRKEADQCYDYRAGHQWDPEDKTKLDEEHRPAVTFNRVDPLVKAVSGLEVNNRQSVIFLPRQTQLDDAISELYTNCGKWVRDENFAEDEESEAFKDLTICGEGWTEMRMDFDEDPQGKIVEERIDPREMGVNKGASRANYVDARLIYRVREMDPDDVRALLDLPDDLNDDALDASSWLDARDTTADGGKGFKKDYPDKTPARVRANGGVGRDTVKVVQCQYWKRERTNYVAMEGDENPIELNDEEFDKFTQRANALGLKHAASTQTRKVFYQCFLGIRILGDCEPMQMQCFQFQAMTGERDSKKKCFYGMVRDMIRSADVGEQVPQPDDAPYQRERQGRA
jgi:hypothetical protein